MHTKNWKIVNAKINTSTIQDIETSDSTKKMHIIR